MKQPRFAGWWVAIAIGTVACTSPSDVLVDPPSFTPVEDQQGRFRVTAGAGPDVARGFLPDGRLLFRTFDLPPFGRDWVLVSAPLEGGLIREELGVYRPALLDDISHLATEGTRRVMVHWKAPVPGYHGCPDSSMTTAGTPGPAPRTPSPVSLTFHALPAVDGIAIANIPSRFVSTNVVAGAYTNTQRVRVSPAVRDADETGTNAFGPVIVPGMEDLIYSDGESLWRASIADTAAVPQFIGAGAYPALSQDGRTLAYARPTGVDSTVTRFSIPFFFASCEEEYVDIRAAGWEVVLRDLESGAEQVLAEGREPAFDPAAPRLVVRGPELRWVEVATGAATPVPFTTGAVAPTLSPDGAILAFSLFGPDTQADVYFLRLSR